MPSVIRRLEKAGLVEPPHWLTDNLMFEGIGGSKAYGCEEPDDTDEDIIAVAIPPKHMVFPHVDGHVPGFGTEPPNFESWQRHHIQFNETKRQYDIAVHSIVKFFHLAMGNNPNMLEILFLPHRCIHHSTVVYEKMRTHRKLFLHRGCYHKFRGYAYSQLSRMQKGGKKRSEKRQQTVREHGFDTKFAYHIVRLMLECEQIFKDQTIVLDRDREMFKSIRRGEWTVEKIVAWFEDKESHMEKLYHAPKEEVPIPDRPDEGAIRDLLIECLEDHYGSVSNAVTRPDEVGRMLNDLKEVVHRYDRRNPN